MICLGYMLLKPHALKGGRRPAAISVSADFCDTVPGPWCLSWTSPGPRPADFSAEEVTALTRFAEPAFKTKWGWPDLILDQSWAYEIHQNWTRAKGYRLYAIASRTEDVQLIIQATRPPAQLPGYAPMGEMGIYTGASRAELMAEPCQVTGWQVVKLDALTAYRDIYHAKDLERANDGLLPDEATAVATARKAQEEEKGEVPQPWIPLALVQLPNHETVSMPRS
jgi:hypothetical protein